MKLIKSNSTSRTTPNGKRIETTRGVIVKVSHRKMTVGAVGIRGRLYLGYNIYKKSIPLFSLPYPSLDRKRYPSLGRKRYPFTAELTVSQWLVYPRGGAVVKFLGQLGYAAEGSHT